MDPRKISIDDYSYDLPHSRIAERPLSERDASKLLIYKEGKIIDDRYANIADHIPAGSLLIFNDTKVIEARLLFPKLTGGLIEIFCLYPNKQHGDIASAMQTKNKVFWHCLIGGVSKWKPGQVLSKIIDQNDIKFSLSAKYIEKGPQDFLVSLEWDTEHTFAEILHFAGAIPLPPYIKRQVDKDDAVRYQTVFANMPGSVAAPTAGLHFTDTILSDLDSKKIKTDFITLHVGAGTFKPVKADMIGAHEMHEESFTITRENIQNIISHTGNIIVVGTTTFRTIESLYWLGKKISSGKLLIEQWEPYEESEPDNVSVVLSKLLQWMDEKKTNVIHGSTSILVAPGYTPRIIKGLITNFHQPRSTLLLLVSALIGKNWRNVYEHALKNGYRFLSYGDGSLLWL